MQLAIPWVRHALLRSLGLQEKQSWNWDRTLDACVLLGRKSVCNSTLEETVTRTPNSHAFQLSAHNLSITLWIKKEKACPAVNTAWSYLRYLVGVFSVFLKNIWSGQTEDRVTIFWTKSVFVVIPIRWSISRGIGLRHCPTDKWLEIAPLGFAFYLRAFLAFTVNKQGGNSPPSPCSCITSIWGIPRGSTFQVFGFLHLISQAPIKS